MRSSVVTTWSALAATAVVATGVGVALLGPTAPAGNDGLTAVGGVSVTAPAEGAETVAASAGDSADARPRTASQPGTPGKEGKPGRPSGNEPGSALEVKGSVAGLYPGRWKSLPLVFENTNNFAVDIVDMTISPSATGTCSSDNLELPQTWSPRRVAANSEQTVTVQVRLAPTAGTECAGDTFALTYSGKAVKA